MKLFGSDDSRRCSFCGKKDGDTQKMAVSEQDRQACMCGECLSLCGTILEDSLDGPANGGGAANIFCSFCGKSSDDVRKLISSPADWPRYYICDECVVAFR